MYTQLRSNVCIVNHKLHQKIALIHVDANASTCASHSPRITQADVVILMTEVTKKHGNEDAGITSKHFTLPRTILLCKSFRRPSSNMSQLLKLVGIVILETS